MHPVKSCLEGFVSARVVRVLLIRFVDQGDMLKLYVVKETHVNILFLTLNELAEKTALKLDELMHVYSIYFQNLIVVCSWDAKELLERIGRQM